MQGIFQDLRYGVRMMVKRPGFSLAALVTLALGIGANTAVFSVINTVLLKREPYPNAESLVIIWGKLKRVDEVEVSPRELASYRERSRAFAEIGAGEIVNLNLTGGGDPLRLQGYAVTDNLFPALGSRPLLGRTFTAREDNERARVAVLDYSLWRSRFAGSEAVIGSTITLDGSGYTVIGVMPEEFHYPPPISNRTPADIFVPRSIASETRLDAHNLVAVGLLRPGVSYEQARIEFEEISRRRKEEDSRTQIAANLVPLTAAVGRRIRPSLLILAGAVGLVLLIACANVANLLLAGATARRNEIAVRMALGAGRWRIARQMLIESLLLSISGGILGLLLAVWAGDLVRLLGESRIPRADQIGVDGAVLGFTLLISTLTGFVFGLAPALQASHGDLNASLKEGGRGAIGGNNRVHGALVVVEVALSLVLLIGAGLMLKSFWRLLDVEPGFDPKSMLNVELALPETKYSEESRIRSFQASVLERVSALPGVRSAAIVNHPPYSGRRGISAFRIEGRPEGLDETPLADFRIVSPGYFQLMGIPILQGRTLSEGDAEGAPPAVLVNRSFVARYMPDENPIGKRLAIDDAMAMIVGVAGDIRQSGLDDEAAPHVYVSSLQFPMSRFGLLVRTSVDPMSLSGSIRGQVQAVDRGQPVYNIATMEERIDETMSERRLYLWLLGSFAAIALALATVGIYGVISYSVTRRTHEIGIRLALGARTSDMRRMVIRQGMVPALIGVVIGLASALALGRIIESMLFQTAASDPATFAMVSLTLAGVALLACLIPARRAARIDPMTALRCE